MRAEHGDARPARDDVLPLIGRSGASAAPAAHPAPGRAPRRSSSSRSANRANRRPPLAAAVVDLERLGRRQLILVGQRWQLPPLQRGRPASPAGSAPGEIDLLLREAVEGGLGEPKFFASSGFGSVADPVGDAERAKLRKVAVVEDQDEVRRLVPQAFEHVAMTAGKVPDVAGVEVVRLRTPCGSMTVVRTRSFDHEGPLGGGGMPVQLAHHARLEPHRDAGQPLGDRQLLDGRLLAIAAADDSRQVKARERSLRQEPQRTSAGRHKFRFFMIT